MLQRIGNRLCYYWYYYNSVVMLLVELSITCPCNDFLMLQRIGNRLCYYCYYYNSAVILLVEHNSTVIVICFVYGLLWVNLYHHPT